jgi:hypothetical protein
MQRQGCGGGPFRGAKYDAVSSAVIGYYGGLAKRATDHSGTQYSAHCGSLHRAHVLGAAAAKGNQGGVKLGGFK